jgi:hypothetical protein
MQMPRILHPWEEAVGVEHGLDSEGDSLLAKIGPIVVVLPPEMEDVMRSLIGRRVGILRVDDRDRPYRLRVFEDVPRR